MYSDIANKIQIDVGIIRNFQNRQGINKDSRLFDYR